MSDSGEGETILLKCNFQGREVDRTRRERQRTISLPLPTTVEAEAEEEEKEPLLTSAASGTFSGTSVTTQQSGNCTTSC